MRVSMSYITMKMICPFKQDLIYDLHCNLEYFSKGVLHRIECATFLFLSYFLGVKIIVSCANISLESNFVFCQCSPVLFGCW